MKKQPVPSTSCGGIYVPRRLRSLSLSSKKGKFSAPVKPATNITDDDSDETYCSEIEGEAVKPKKLTTIPSVAYSPVPVKSQITQDLFDNPGPTTPGKLGTNLSLLRLGECDDSNLQLVYDSQDQDTNLEPLEPLENLPRTLYDPDGIRDELSSEDEFANVTIRRPYKHHAPSLDSTEVSEDAPVIVLDSSKGSDHSSSEYSRIVSQLPEEEFFNNPPDLSAQQSRENVAKFHPRNCMPAPAQSKPQSPQRIPATPSHIEPIEIPTTPSEPDETPKAKKGPGKPRRRRRRTSSDSNSESSYSTPKVQYTINLSVNVNIQATGTMTVDCMPDDRGEPSPPDGRRVQEKQTGENLPSGNVSRRASKSPEGEMSFPLAPSKALAESFLDAEEIKTLNEVYGVDLWKTPRMMQKMKQHDASKCAEFDSNTRPKHESTRLPRKLALDSTSRRSPPRPPSSSSADTPPRKQTFRPKALQICDTDTSSDDSVAEASDDDDSWHVSSESDRSDSPESTKSSNKKSGRNPKPVQIANDRAKNPLAEFENKDKPKIPPTPGRRKLFSAKRYDEELENAVTTDSGNKNRRSIMDEDISRIEDDTLIMTVPEFLIPKPPMKKKETPKMPTKSVSKIVDPLKDKNTGENSKVFSFVASLDVKASEGVCDVLALYYRQAYKHKKEELAEKLFAIYNEKIFESKLSIPIEWSKTLRKTAGQCKYSRRIANPRTATIILSEKVLTSADRLRCTLIHEMCHAATWIINGQSDGHGPTWRAWADKSNKIFPELPKIKTCHTYAIEYKYSYKCEKCNVQQKAHSKSKKVEKIRCKYCHGPIVIHLNKWDKDGQIKSTPVRKASGFAKFVKDRYKLAKKPKMTHAEVMQVLSKDFNSLTVEEKKMYA